LVKKKNKEGFGRFYFDLMQEEVYPQDVGAGLCARNVLLTCHS